MGKMLKAELALQDATQEAKDFIVQAATLHHQIVTSQKELHSKINSFKQEYMVVFANLKKEYKASAHILHMAEGQKMWKEAVLETFGEEGLQKIFDYMEAKK